MKRLVVVAILLALLMSCAPKSERPVIWVLLPAASAEVEKSKYEDARQYLEETLGRPVTLRTVTNYAAVTLALKQSNPEEETMICRFGPFEFVLANTQVEVEALARGVKKSTGKDAYYSLIVARQDSGITGLDDLRGKIFAFVDIGSTSGYLIPKAIFGLAEIGEEDFKKVYFAGSHEAVILAIKNGSVAAGAVADNRYQDAIDDGVIGEDEFVVIHRSEAIANSPIAVRADLDEETKALIRDAFLNMPGEITESTAKVLGYVPAANEDYDFIIELARSLGLME